MNLNSKINTQAVKRLSTAPYVKETIPFLAVLALFYEDNNSCFWNLTRNIFFCETRLVNEYLKNAPVIFIYEKNSCVTLFLLLSE